MLTEPAAAFDTQAPRSRSTTRTRRRSATSSASRWPSVDGRVREALRRRDAQAHRRAGALRRFGLRLAQIFETQIEDVDSAVARYRAVLEVDPENAPRFVSLDRLFTIPSAGPTRRDPRATGRDRRAADDILEAKYRLGQVHQTRLADLPSRSPAYREVLAAAPEHTATLEALEGLFSAA